MVGFRRYDRLCQLTTAIRNGVVPQGSIDDIQKYTFIHPSTKHKITLNYTSLATFHISVYDFCAIPLNSVVCLFAYSLCVPVCGFRPSHSQSRNICARKPTHTKTVCTRPRACGFNCKGGGSARGLSAEASKHEHTHAPHISSEHHHPTTNGSSSSRHLNLGAVREARRDRTNRHAVYYSVGRRSAQTCVHNTRSPVDSSRGARAFSVRRARVHIHMCCVCVCAYLYINDEFVYTF